MLSTILDVIYQLIVHRGVYTLELLITAVTLAVVPYILVRGPINRIAKIASAGRSAGGQSRRKDSTRPPTATRYSPWGSFGRRCGA
jgi:hypothetical protein